MKLRTHAACGILLASLVLHIHQFDAPLNIFFWAVLWSAISDLDAYIPTVQHREITHTLAFALFSGALVLALGFFTPFYAALASLCVILHLLMDSLTPKGVPLWMPFSTKRVRFPIIGGKIRSDNWFANTGIQIAAIGAAIMIIHP